MPAGGTLLTKNFGGSLLTEFDRLTAVVFVGSVALFASRDSCMNSIGSFSAVSVSYCRNDKFVLSVLVNPLCRGTASSSGSLIAVPSRSVLYTSSKFGMDVMESKLLLLLPLLSLFS